MPERFLDAGRIDPVAAYNFFIELKGAGIIGAFRECSAISDEHQVIEYRAADESGKTVIYKVPGPRKYGDITVKRGVTNDMKLWEWRKKVVEGNIDKARASGSLIVYNYADQQEVARWNFDNAWPSKLSTGPLNATSSEVLIEELTIVCEKIERVK
jgi:phage tail-like protein